jgi:hypothetical protein
MNETILLLIFGNPHLDFLYRREKDGKGFTLDTRQLREILGEDVPLMQFRRESWLKRLWHRLTGSRGSEG